MITKTPHNVNNTPHSEAKKNKLNASVYILIVSLPASVVVPSLLRTSSFVSNRVQPKSNAPYTASNIQHNWAITISTLKISVAI